MRQLPFAVMFDSRLFPVESIAKILDSRLLQHWLLSDHQDLVPCARLDTSVPRVRQSVPCRDTTRSLGYSSQSRVMRQVPGTPATRLSNTLAIQYLCIRRVLLVKRPKIELSCRLHLRLEMFYMMLFRVFFVTPIHDFNSNTYQSPVNYPARDTRQ